MRKIIFTTLLVGALIQIGFAQNFDKSKLDSYLDAFEANNKFMGSVAVSKNGAVIYSKSVGFSDIENNVKANENTKYRIGSISKTFTSVLVLKAVEEKKLDLEQTIDRYFPAIENAAKITIRHLLNHRSGIPNFTNNADYLTWHTQPKTAKELTEIIAKAGTDFEPDSKAEYSNSNFVLLTYILEESFQKTYAELLKQHITQPIGLKNTYLGGRIDTDNNESKSYRMSGTWKAESETDISIPLGAGGITSTSSDLVKFSDALFNGKLLKKESLEIMETIRDNYGIGLIKIPFYDMTGYGHPGGIDGFTSVFTHFSDGDISYALTSNATNINNNDISIAILSAIYDKPYHLPEFSEVTFDVNSEDLDKYLGTYSSTQIPLKIEISKEGNILIAQATGQSAFSLEATEQDKFKFEQGGIVLEFNPAEKAMTLIQGGGQFMFTKE